MEDIKKIPALRFPEFSGEWEVKILEKCNLKVIDGDRGKNYPNGNDFSKNGYCLFLNAKNVTKNGFSFEEKYFITKEKDEKLSKGKLKRHDIILTTRGTVGNISYYNEKINFKHIRINSGMVLIRNENETIKPEFLYKQFNSPVLSKQIKKIAFGSAQPQLTVKEIKKFKISTAKPDEQQKISDFLTKIDNKIEQLSKKKQLLESYKKGSMQKIFSQELRFKDDEGKDYPDWEEKKLVEIATFHRGANLSKSDLVDNGNTECVHYGELFTMYDEIIKSVTSSTNNKEGVKSKSGDILMPSSDVTPQGLGRASALMKDDVLLGGDINIVRSNKDIDSIFLSYLINYDKNKVIRLVTGTTVKHIYTKDLKTISINLPSLIEEQTKIASFLTEIDKKVSFVEKQLNNSKEYKKGLLQKMFV